jgi:2,5-dihydroxypyridine 5,6-dioxygenase
MTALYEYELAKAATTLIVEHLGLQKGETIMITADTLSDMRVVDAVAAAAHTAGGKPMAIIVASPLGVGKTADAWLPVEPLTAALLKADAWVELNKMYVGYSSVGERALAENKKLRYINMTGMDVEMIVRLVGRVNTPMLSKFMLEVTRMTQETEVMRITTPSGNDLSFKLLPKERAVLCEDGYARLPGAHYLAGQICFYPDYPTINGKLVFDGPLSPPGIFLDTPATLDVEAGRVVRISGGPQADQYRAWLESFDDPNMFRIAHGCYGFLPGAKLTGNVIEDERVWGCTQWGLGYVSAIDVPPDGINAKSHTDGICPNSSVWLDGVQIMDKGLVIHPALKSLADAVLNGES